VNFGMTSMVERMKARRVASTFLILATLVLGILIGTVIQKGVKGKEASRASLDATPLSIPEPKQLSSAFSTIAKQLEPAVVNINTESTVKQSPRSRGRRRGQAPDDQDPFQDFFDRFFGGQGGGEGSPFGGSPEGMRERSLGSGVIVDQKGYILTNHHVVERADRIQVKLMDDPPGVKHTAKLIGSDTETDLAVIKIDSDGPLPYAKLGNSDSLNVGDWVLAIGSPFGLEESVTAGIISSQKRSIDPRRQFQNFLQTDAAINPGNSGGPLVNMNGEVIGINTAIYTQSAGYQGVGFAMPSNIVAKVYNDLIGPEHKVTRGSIGVTFNAEASPAIARVYGVKNGVTVSDVTSGGPAEQAGIKAGDTITTVDGKPIKDGDELVGEISARKPGSKVKLGLMREGKQQEATVTVGDRAKLYASRLGDEEENTPEARPVEGKIGITVRPLTQEMADRLSVPRKGVIVQEVKPGSFGEEINLQRGDIILEINRQPVNNDEDFRKIQSQLKSGQDVAMLVRQAGRNGGTIFYGGTLP
jgi:serine protease Do